MCVFQNTNGMKWKKRMFDIRRIYVTQFFDLYQLHLDEA